MAFVQLQLPDAEANGLPEVCMRCGAPAGYGETVKFNWHSAKPGRLTGFFEVIIYLFKAIWTSRTVKVRLPLCSRHRYHFFWRRWLLRAYGLLTLVGLIVAFNIEDENLSFQVGRIAFSGVILWPILYAVFTVTAIQVREIDDRSITLCGVSPRFVEAYEQWQAKSRLDVPPP